VFKDCDLIGPEDPHSHSSSNQSSESALANVKGNDRAPGEVPSCRRVKVGRQTKMIIMQQLLIDTQFLQSLGIMDYSFLLGIHNVSPENFRERPPPVKRTLIPLRRNKLQKDFVSRIQKESLLERIPAKIVHRPWDCGGPNASEETKRQNVKANLDRLAGFYKKKIVNVKDMVQGFERMSETGEAPDVDAQASENSPAPVEKKPSESKRREVQENKAESKKKYISIFHRDHGGIRSDVFEGPPSPLKGKPENPGKKIEKSKRQQIYFFGIIDCLQAYTMEKMAETGLKGIVHDWTKVSSVPPPMYASRFIKFINNVIE